MIVVNDEPVPGPYDSIAQQAVMVSIGIVIAIVMSDETRPVVVHDASRSGRIVPMRSAWAVPSSTVCRPAACRRSTCRDSIRRSLSVHSSRSGASAPAYLCLTSKRTRTVRRLGGSFGIYRFPCAIRFDSGIPRNRRADRSTSF
jgi:hypothetical protein